MSRLRRLGWLAAALLGLGGLAVAALWLSVPDVAALRTRNPETTAFIELRKAEAEEAGKKLRLRFTWRPLARISPLLRTAVIHAEDIRFFEHTGVDWEAIQETAERDWRDGSLQRGGSTITQQLAKNLYLSPRRSLIRKLRELFITWRLEGELGKDRILELYLNVAEWGPGIFGAEAAARAWFGCSAASLDAYQAARLAVALPNPMARSPRVQSATLDRKAARLVRALYRGGLIGQGELASSLTRLGQPPKATAPPPTPEEQKEPPEVPAAEVPADPVGQPAAGAPAGPIGPPPAGEAGGPADAR